MTVLRILLTALLFPTLLTYAQTAGKEERELLLSIKVMDSFSRETIGNATVTVYGEDSTTLLLEKMKLHRGYYNGQKTTDEFKGYVKRQNRYVLRISNEGYTSQYVTVVVPNRRYGRAVREWTVKDVLLRKDYALTERTLGEAQVTASRVAMVVRGDTIEYDARAFRLAEGSMLDNLMKMLPGMRLTADGQIFVNGEYVSKLMVNGRDFFNGNPKVALDNLPAYTVDKVKAYHEGPQWEHLIDDKNPDTGRRPMVVDVRLKREYAQGWLANIEAAGGTQLYANGDAAYLARFFAMRHTDHSGISLYGSINNLGDNQSPGRKGEWKKMDVTQGERVVKTGGLNVSIDGKKTGTTFNSTVEVRREDILADQRSTSVSYLNDREVTERSIYRNDAGRTDVAWKGRITTRSKRSWLQVHPYVKYLHNRNDEQNSTEEETRQGQDGSNVPTPVYSRKQIYRITGDNLNIGLNLRSQLKSPLSGKNYEITGSADYRHETGLQEQTDHLLWHETKQDATTQRRDALPRRRYAYDAGIGRNLFGKKLSAGHFGFDLSYRYTQKYESGRRERDIAEQENPADATSQPGKALPSAVGEWHTDYANSFHTAETQRRHQINVRAAFSRKHFRINASLVGTADNRDIRDIRNQTPLSLRKKAFFVLPMLSIQYRKLQLTYLYDTEMPEMLQLLPINDTADPLNIRLGNEHLKPKKEHTFHLSYRTTNKKRQRTFSASLNYDLGQHAIGIARTYDSQTGIITRQPMNISGNRRSTFDLNYGQAIDKSGRLMLATFTRFAPSHSVDFAIGNTTGKPVRSAVDNYSLKEELSLNYRTINGLHIGAKGQVTYTAQTSNRPAFRNAEWADYSYGLTLTWPIVNQLSFETDIMAYARRGYTDTALNTTEWVWNASLSYAFGRKKAWLVRAVGFDLLHQLSSVRREVNEQGYTETWYNTVPSYATLHLVYRLDIKPKKVK